MDLLQQLSAKLLGSIAHDGPDIRVPPDYYHVPHYWSFLLLVLPNWHWKVVVVTLLLAMCKMLPIISTMVLNNAAAIPASNNKKKENKDYAFSSSAVNSCLW